MGWNFFSRQITSKNRLILYWLYFRITILRDIAQHYLFFHLYLCLEVLRFIWLFSILFSSLSATAIDLIANAIWYHWQFNWKIQLPVTTCRNSTSTVFVVNWHLENFCKLLNAVPFRDIRGLFNFCCRSKHARCIDLSAAIRTEFCLPNFIQHSIPNKWKSELWMVSFVYHEMMARLIDTMDRKQAWKKRWVTRFLLFPEYNWGKWRI